MGLKAVGECLDYFGFMAERTGTLWEHDSTYASCNHGFESYVANLIVSGLTGFVYADVSKRKLYMSETDYGVDCRVAIPVGNEKVTLTVENGRLHTQIPDGYCIKVIGG